MIKKLLWLIKHQEEIKEIIDKKPDKKADEKYSTAGVPDFQKDYVNDLLSGKLKENN